MKKLSLLVFGVILVLGLTTLVNAIGTSTTIGIDSVAIGASENMSTYNPGNATAGGGNITQFNLTTTTTTQIWQGYYGQINVSVKMGIGADVLRDFGEADKEGQISTLFATGNKSLDFSSIVRATSADISSLRVNLGTNPSFPDAVTSMFDVNDNATIANTSGVMVINLNAYNVSNQSIAQNDYFKVGALKGSGDATFRGGMLFAAPVLSGIYAFENTSIVNYEMILPTNETTHTYHFFLDMDLS